MSDDTAGLGPLGLTLLKPDGLSPDTLRKLADDLNAIWAASLNNKDICKNTGGPAHWMMIDIVRAVEGAMADAGEKGA